MSIPLEKILTISAGDYCEMRSRKLSDYEAKGVHVGEGKVSISAFRERVPEGTEVVVGFQYAMSIAAFDEGNTRYLCGTALIPK